jgi:hypothetical protein
MASSPAPLLVYSQSLPPWSRAIMSAKLPAYSTEHGGLRCGWPPDTWWRPVAPRLGSPDYRTLTTGPVPSVALNVGARRIAGRRENSIRQ